MPSVNKYVLGRRLWPGLFLVLLFSHRVAFCSHSCEQDSLIVNLPEPALKMRIRYDVQTIDEGVPVVLASGSKVLVRDCNADSCYVWPYKKDPTQSFWDRLTDEPEIIVDRLPRKVPRQAVRPKRFHRYSHQPISRPLFEGSLSASGVPFEQGEVGDCVLMAGLASLIIQNQAALKDMFTDESDTCIVRLYRPSPHDEENFVALRLRTRKSLVSKKAGPDPHATGALYAAILEKAILDILLFFKDEGSVASYHLLNGIRPSRVLAALTGRQVFGAELAKYKSEEERKFIVERLQTRLSQKEIVIAGSATNVRLLPGDHAYAVLSVTEEDGQTFVTVYNPHGDTQPRLSYLLTLLGFNKGVAYSTSFWRKKKYLRLTGAATSRLKIDDFFKIFRSVFWTSK